MAWKYECKAMRRSQLEDLTRLHLKLFGGAAFNRHLSNFVIAVLIVDFFLAFLLVGEPLSGIPRQGQNRLLRDFTITLEHRSRRKPGQNYPIR
ncbi:MAG: hypothetical protein WA220_06575 [Candidatus Nitrosopolaris sp.]